MKKTVLLFTVACTLLTGCKHLQSSSSAEGPLKPHLGEAKFDVQPLFPNERFGNVVVSMEGTIIATWGTSHVRARRSEDGGQTWGPDIVIAKPGFQPGGITVNEANGDIIAFVEDRHPPAPIHVYVSSDDGKTWNKIETNIKPDSKGNDPSMHMNEHGITLRHGKHKGRLIRPSRWYAGQNHSSKWPQHYTNAIYSDDLRGVRTSQVERDAALAGVDNDEGPTFTLDSRNQAHGITRRRFDLDHIGAETGEKPATVRNGCVLREFDDLDAIEHTGRRAHCFAISLLAVAACSERLERWGN